MATSYRNPYLHWAGAGQPQWHQMAWPCLPSDTAPSSRLIGLRAHASSLHMMDMPQISGQRGGLQEGHSPSPQDMAQFSNLAKGGASGPSDFPLQHLLLPRHRVLSPDAIQKQALASAHWALTVLPRFRSPMCPEPKRSV